MVPHRLFLAPSSTTSLGLFRTGVRSSSPRGRRRLQLSWQLRSLKVLSLRFGLSKCLQLLYLHELLSLNASNEDLTKSSGYSLTKPFRF